MCLGVLGALSGPAMAIGLVEGRSLGAAFDDAGRASADRSGPLVLQFTPRSSAQAGLEPGKAEGGLSFRLELDGVAADRATLGLLGYGPSETSRSATRSGFRLGGAFDLGAFSVGASVAQDRTAALDLTLVGAEVGYGALTARLARGRSESLDVSADRDFWLFSTNLAARSWLSLEGDVGYTPAQRADPASTVGRVGLKLKF